MFCMQKVRPYGQELLVKKKKRKENSRNAIRIGKRQQRIVSSQLAFSNTYSILYPENLDNKIHYQSNTERIRDIQYTLQPPKEVQIKVGLEKIESNGATGLFMNTQFVKEKGFKLKRLKNPLLVRNVDGIINIGGAIIHQVKYNMFFKGHIERVRIYIYNLGKTEVILEMPWLATYNLEIDWEKEK